MLQRPCPARISAPLDERFWGARRKRELKLVIDIDSTIPIDGLAWFGEGARGVFANVFCVHNGKKIVKCVLQAHSLCLGGIAS